MMKKDNLRWKRVKFRPSVLIAHFKYTYIHISKAMAHKTITISDDAYEALAKSRKTIDESFTKVILRLTSERTKASSLLKHLETSQADEELARSVEEAMQRTRSAHLKPAEFSRR
jgi:predicted CopG family antitoxin